MKKKYLINVNILPMTNEKVIINDAYLILGDYSIEEIGCIRELKFPINDAEIFDLEGGYLLPGLIDLHAHVIGEARTDLERLRKSRGETHFEIGCRAVHNLQEAIKSGVTTIFDCGSPGDFTFLLRDAIENKIFDSPRLFICGPILTSPGNHGEEFGVGVMGSELPEMINELKTKGVDFIKIVNDPIGYTFSDLKKAVSVSHRLGLKVACHAYTEEAIWLALKSGCDSIEHGVSCSDKMLDYIKGSKVGIVPTYFCALKSCENLDKSLISSSDAEAYFFPWLNLLKSNLPDCLSDTNVLVGAGTDAGFPPISFNSVIHEIKSFVQLGASNFEALSSATVLASKIRGIENKLGTVEIGKMADLIVVENNPLQDIEYLNEVLFVMKGGRVVKDVLSRKKIDIII